MIARRCKRCRFKPRCYSEMRAYHAALSSSRAFGRPFRIYMCPFNDAVFHLAKGR